MQEHNTREIRAAARNLDNLADQLRRLASSDISRITSNARPLKGDTAAALQSLLESLSSDIMAVKRGIDQGAGALYEYARQLDIADARARAMIGNS